jgi:hypothetical protein
MKATLFALAAAAAIAVAACGGGSPGFGGTSPPPASPTGGAPLFEPAPGAALSARAGRVPGGIGTHCWDGFCRDMTGPVTGAALFEMAPSEPFALDFEEPDPDEVVLSWYAAPTLAPPPSGGEIAWSIDPRLATRAGAAAAPAEPGLYILAVFARWGGKGDVSYGWYIEVR